MKIILLFLFIFTSCSPLDLHSMNISEEINKRLENTKNLKKLKPGMAMSQVKTLIGEPDDITFDKGLVDHFYNKVSPPKIITYRNNKVLSVKNNNEEITRRHELKKEEIKSKPIQPTTPIVIFNTDHSRDFSCYDENIHGKYAKGGGCNIHGCWPPGGSCSIYGCSSTSSKCGAINCPNKIKSFDCSNPHSHKQLYMKCTDENFHGKFVKGGGCNFHGCWPPGGSCSMHGCSATSSKCEISNCPNKIESFKCLEE